jgi:Putative MetA-pathway of phenol degradation
MTHPLRVALAAICVCAIAPPPAAAQSPLPINTDRPSFTSAPRVVGPGVVQIETGLVLLRDAIETRTAERTESSATAPNVLMRLGMTRALELRAEMAGWVRTDSGRPQADARTSVSDLALAVEYQFARQDGLGVDLAVIAGSTLPVGGRVSSGAADPFARLVWGRDLGSAASLGGTLNWSVPTTESERRRTLDASLVFGHALVGPLSAFWEGVMRHEDLDDDPAIALGNVGLLWAFSPDWQLDAWVGRGLNDRAPDWRLGVGAAYRFRR